MVTFSYTEAVVDKTDLILQVWPVDGGCLDRLTKGQWYKGRAVFCDGAVRQESVKEPLTVVSLRLQHTTQFTND